MFEHIWEEEERNKRIRREKKNLKKIFSNIEKDKQSVCSGLIENAAFQRVALEELTLIIERDGYIEEYQNGANQSGIKKSAASEVYDKTLNTYSKIIKQLCDLLPDTDTKIPGADLLEFIKGGT